MTGGINDVVYQHKARAGSALSQNNRISIDHITQEG